MEYCTKNAISDEHGLNLNICIIGNVQIIRETYVNGTFVKYLSFTSCTKVHGISVVRDCLLLEVF
jgi:hypothetical protein